ncbi:hypothetical protein GRF59_05235 [Paenibacillus sp. HJL G12]|uniref:TerB N-terminal domain-containing protein n=1 Tax=Paenibacillus dendrobii TaxID=2691084 RepID=A0A7X3LEY3_9BACL|nr:TerB N-terminal domain-containing protein [Paenibacillus dendrobii]MWV43026.1 hypothetical protein [Paenibacillus dendrobii]
MDSYKNPLNFAEIDISDEGEQGSPTLRGMSIPERKERPAGESIPYVKALSREQQFVHQARALADRTDEQTPFVPFMSYWPTYEQMNEAQRSWYFYWRSEVRAGQYLFTDLSYIFVYLYELINGTGWEIPKQGYELMMKLWEAYGKRYPKLNGYIADWVCDFVLVHQMDVSLMDIVSRSQTTKTGELFDLELMRLFTDDPASLTFEQILTLSDYDMQRSKFYLDGGSVLLEEFAPKVIALVDSFLRKTTGNKLVDTFYKGSGKKIERYLFRSAVYDASIYGRTRALRIPQLRRCSPLRYYITQLLRCMENKLRELHHFKGRLRGVTLKTETEMVVQRFLDKEFKPEKPAVPAISIDPKRLAELQRDSEDVRSMLTVAEWDEPEQEEQEYREYQNQNDQSSSDVSPDPAKSSTGVNDDVPIHEFVHTSRPEPSHEHEDSAANDTVLWDTSDMDEEWILFAGMLGQAHLEILYALHSPSSSIKIDRIADKYGTMPALLLDEINEIAMEAIGDLVVDGESLSEDYKDYFESLKR